MARIVDESVAAPKEWKVIIRCAQPICGMGLHRVDGCFRLLEVSREDVFGHRDFEGDLSIWVNCPSCGTQLYFQWQLDKSNHIPIGKLV